MARRRSTVCGTETRWPAPPQPCIWMSAGVLSFRLCDRDYQCDSCPLDRALRGLPAPGDEDRPEESASVGWVFPEDRTYHAWHVWTLEVEPGRLRFGIDALSARLLEPATGVVLPVPGSPVAARESCCWIQSSAGLVPVRSAVSGTVLRSNTALEDLPARLTGSPYGEGWLIDIRPEPPGPPPGVGPRQHRPRSVARACRGLPGLAASEARKRSTEQLDRLRREVGRSAAGKAAAAVGPALADGGEPLTRWADILGPRRYRELVLPLLV